MISIKIYFLFLVIINAMATEIAEDSAVQLTLDDMKLTVDQQRTTKLRNAYILTKKWPNGVVPYTIDSKLTKDAFSMKAIQNAMNIYKTSTCLRWIPRTTEKNYVQFFDGGAGQCYSSVGMINSSPQQISIGKGCESAVGVIMHEMMHTMGFMHEHMRPDRDNYVNVVTSKIQKGMLGQFTKLSPTDVNEQNLAYDYLSVMHYPARSFSIDGSSTIETKDKSFQNRIGQRTGFSKCDLEKLNKYYNCTAKITNDASCRVKSPPVANNNTGVIKPNVTTNVSNCNDNNPMMCKLSQQMCLNYPGHYLFNCRKMCNNCDGKRCMDTNIQMFSSMCSAIRQNPSSCTDPMQKVLCPKACGMC